LKEMALPALQNSQSLKGKTNLKQNCRLQRCKLATP
jgi:hypothetical protein